MTQRSEFVALAYGHGMSVVELSCWVGISRKTPRKWLHLEAVGESLADRSCAPQPSPTHTGEAVAAAMLAWRCQHPCWGEPGLHMWSAGEPH